MTWLARLLLLPILALPVVLISAPPASACSCVSGTVKDFVEWADVVFVATVADGLGENASGGVAETKASVEHVYEGEVDDVVSITTSGSEASCGLNGVGAGETWLFFGTGGYDAVEVSLCGGSTVADSGLRENVKKLLGPGEAVVAPVDDPGDSDPGGTPPWLLPGGLVVLAAGAVALIVRSRRATSPSA